MREPPAQRTERQADLGCEWDAGGHAGDDSKGQADHRPDRNSGAGAQGKQMPVIQTLGCGS